MILKMDLSADRRDGDYDVGFNNEKRPYILFAFLMLTFAIAIIGISRNAQKKSTEMVKRIQTIMTKPLPEISVTPYQLSPEKWQVVISEHEDIANFMKSVAMADTQQISGHSGPIGEWTLTFGFELEKQNRFLASVHKYEPNDLFLTDTFFEQTKLGTYCRGKTRTARLSGLGQWIMQHLSVDAWQKYRVGILQQGRSAYGLC